MIVAPPHPRGIMGIFVTHFMAIRLKAVCDIEGKVKASLREGKPAVLRKQPQREMQHDL